jgi:hypothetical protein
MSELKSNTTTTEASKGGGPVEIIFAVLVCALAMFLPILVIENGYEQFTREHGITREGAAGATLALAVILRTVSRTVLRTIVRTSARTGLRAGIKTALGGVLRIATRNLFASVVKTATRDATTEGQIPEENTSTRRRSNLRSLLMGSVLLYASWVIVIGFGQPFGDLMNAEQAAVAQEAEAKAIAEARSKREQPEVIAWELDQKRDSLREDVRAKRRELKGSRNLEDQDRLANELSDLNSELIVVQTELSDALIRSGNHLAPPEVEKTGQERKAAAELEQWLFTRAPYPGPTNWGSPLIWGGAALFVLPLWFIFFTQAGVARRMGIRLRHETGVDGGLIQLYFAGALSFMPLSSDVVVEGTTAERGRVSMAGILVPTIISIALWLFWKLTGGTLQTVLLASDAFLIYPMVQCFPLDPLDGSRIYRWNRGVWLAIFIVVMGAFIFMGSEGLKNVI